MSVASDGAQLGGGGGGGGDGEGSSEDEAAAWASLPPAHQAAAPSSMPGVKYLVSRSRGHEAGRSRFLFAAFRRGANPFLPAGGGVELAPRAQKNIATEDEKGGVSFAGGCTHDDVAEVRLGLVAPPFRTALSPYQSVRVPLAIGPETTFFALRRHLEPQFTSLCAAEIATYRSASGDSGSGDNNGGDSGDDGWTADACASELASQIEQFTVTACGPSPPDGPCYLAIYREEEHRLVKASTTNES